jgi:hypothetical protein
MIAVPHNVPIAKLTKNIKIFLKCLYEVIGCKNAPEKLVNVMMVAANNPLVQAF